MARADWLDARRAELRGNKLCSLIWDSYEAIVRACKTAWDFLIEDPDLILHRQP